jgi:CDP-diacylglycerol--glycerol-3-phosphate 3-phosphatidyltransferase
MRGLYALKSWFSGLLKPLVFFAVQRKLSPNVFTVIGILGGALAGFGVASVNTWLVLLGVVVRLAGANLDGAVARALRDGAVARAGGPEGAASARESRRGFWINEVGDRLADWAIFAGLLFMPLAMPIDVWVTVMVAVALPTAVSLWGVRRGAARINGGPFGKTERCAFAVVLVALMQFGQVDVLVVSYMLQVLIWASLVTALLRWQRIRANR